MEPSITDPFRRAGRVVRGAFDHIPGSERVRNPLGESLEHARQGRLAGYIGRLVLVGDLNSVKDRQVIDLRAERTVATLMEHEIIKPGDEVGLRMITRAATGRGVHRMPPRPTATMHALKNVLDEMPGLEPERSFVPAEMLDTTERSGFQALDKAITDFEVRARLDDDPLFECETSLLVVMSAYDAAKAFKQAGVSYADLEKGGTAVLRYVGDSPAENQFEPLSPSDP